MKGVPIILISTDAPSKPISDILAKRNWTLPVYFDPRGEMNNVFSSFGTPSYFVLDAAGRIRFDHVDAEASLIAQVEALAAEEGHAAQPSAR